MTDYTELRDALEAAQAGRAADCAVFEAGAKVAHDTILDLTAKVKSLEAECNEWATGNKVLELAAACSTHAVYASVMEKERDAALAQVKALETNLMADVHNDISDEQEVDRLRVELADRVEKLVSARETAERHIQETHAQRKVIEFLRDVIARCKDLFDDIGETDEVAYRKSAVGYAICEAAEKTPA